MPQTKAKPAPAAARRVERSTPPAPQAVRRPVPAGLDSVMEERVGMGLFARAKKRDAKRGYGKHPEEAA